MEFSFFLTTTPNTEALERGVAATLLVGVGVLDVLDSPRRSKVGVLQFLGVAIVRSIVPPNTKCDCVRNNVRNLVID